MKYNVRKGKIVIQCFLRQKSVLINEQPHEIQEFVTNVIDSGKGIEPERQKYLFHLFGELR